jgi:hypothetical protein
MNDGDQVKFTGFIAQEMSLFFQHIHTATANFNESGELPKSLFHNKQIKVLDKYAKALKKKGDKIKRKPTAYNHFVKEKLEQFKATNKKVPEGEDANKALFSMAVGEWKKLSAEEKKEYTDKYAASHGAEEKVVEEEEDEEEGEEDGSSDSDEDTPPNKKKSKH